MRQFPIGIVTLLFTDIEGSTRLLQKLGSRYAEVLRESRRLLRTAFQQGNGYEVDTQGDAFFVVFERADDAIETAAQAQQAFFSAHWPDNTAVRVRMGIHTGEPQAEEEGYIGLDVHRAARIMSAAHGGQVLISQATYDMVVSHLPEGVSLRDLGTYRLKDIAGHSQLFQLVIPGLPSAFLPPATPGFQHSLLNIPVPSTPFVGREQEVATLCQQLLRADVRLLSLIGTVGVGKTRLALQVATQMKDQFPERVYFVALEHVKNEDEVISTIAQALGVQEEKKLSLARHVKAAMSEQSTLLVLDNFEHILPARLIVADLLSSCPGLKVLVTSRVRLHLQAEHLFDVLPLPLPSPEQKDTAQALLHSASIALFVQRAQVVQPDFQVSSANAADIVEICTLLEGIPLAIELAAAHMRHFSLADLLKRLKQGTIFLQGKALDVPKRQQTLRQAISWSYDLLEPAEQCVFRRVAVCANGITPAAAEYVCNAASQLEKNILEILEELVDKSMLRRQGDGKGGSRFWLLQTLREYGLERLSAEDELNKTQAALSEFILSWVEHISPLLAGAEQVDWQDQLDREYENVRLVLSWLLTNVNNETERAEQALRLCIALMRFWEIRCYFAEGLAYLEQALAATPKVSPLLKAQTLHNAGFLALMLNLPTRAEAFLRESQLLFRESGEKTAMANILRLQGNLALMKNSYKTGRRLLEEALLIDQELGNFWRAASTRGALAQAIIAQGSYRKALALLEENLAAYQALGEQYSAAYPLYYMASALFLSCQDQTKARKLAEESLDLFRAVGNKRLMAHVLDLLGDILYAENENDKALLRLEESRDLFKEVEDRAAGTAKVLISLARGAASQSEWKAARSLYEESWAMLQTSDAKALAASCLEGYGIVLAAEDEASQAVNLWGTAAAIRAAIIAPMPPVYRPNYIQAITIAREKLSDESFQAAWVEGSQTPMQQVTLTR